MSSNRNAVFQLQYNICILFDMLACFYEGQCKAFLFVNPYEKNDAFLHINGHKCLLLFHLQGDSVIMYFYGLAVHAFQHFIGWMWNITFNENRIKLIGQLIEPVIVIILRNDQINSSDVTFNERILTDPITSNYKIL